MIKINLNPKLLIKDIIYNINFKDLAKQLDLSEYGLRKKIENSSLRLAEIIILLKVLDLSFDDFCSIYIKAPG
jgi:hypothetical protein